jgi:hypothetical protein
MQASPDYAAHPGRGEFTMPLIFLVSTEGESEKKKVRVKTQKDVDKGHSSILLWKAEYRLVQKPYLIGRRGCGDASGCGGEWLPRSLRRHG